MACRVTSASTKSTSRKNFPHADDEARTQPRFGNNSIVNAELLAKAKSLGFSDRQIAHLTGTTEDAVRAERKRLGLVPSFRLVDTCAAEFEAYTPYYYSTYDRGDDEVKGNTAKKVMILGGGPNRSEE